MRNKIIPFLSLVALFILLFMVNFTSPIKIGAFGVLVFFTMIFVLIFGIVFSIVKVFQKILNPKNFVVNSKTFFYSVAEKNEQGRKKFHPTHEEDTKFSCDCSPLRSQSFRAESA